jgi:hypothetical protein
MTKRPQKPAERTKFAQTTGARFAADEIGLLPMNETDATHRFLQRRYR